MAYSDYGGYAYRNGEHIEDRSDACFTENGLASTPGLWPGFLLAEGRGGGSYHVILGDGPVHVGLYKQSSVTVFVNGDELDLMLLAKETYSGSIESYGDEEIVEFFSTDYFLDRDETAVFDVADHKLELYWTIDDNHYVYARLTQPDGVVWTGFSGYGVGAGLETAGYGYSTEDRIEAMVEHWLSVEVQS